MSTSPARRGSREARERALELLYEAQAKDIGVGAVLAQLPVAPDPYASDLASGVEAHRPELDEVIGRHVREDWSLARMPIVDLTVLRLATEELARRPEVPIGVVISEAVALAKQFSTDEAGRFVNGVLAAVAAELRPDG